MIGTGIKVLIKILLLLVGLGTVILIVSRIIMIRYSLGKVFPPETVPPKPVAIVFGAGVWKDGRPTPVLYDRVATAVALYRLGKIEKLLMSGDNRFTNYNEPQVMGEVAIQMGVPPDAIVYDYAGRRTYDTCYRARVIFGIGEAILVTQGFHLPRALLLCNHLGVASVGVKGNLRKYSTPSLAVWNARELLASGAAFWDIYISHPVPVLGKPEPIFH